MADPLHRRRAPRLRRRAAPAVDGGGGGVLSAVGVVLLTLAGFSLFFFSFLTAPLIVIGILCAVLAISSRPKRAAQTVPAGREATRISEDGARRETIEADATVRGADGRAHPIAQALRLRRRP